jgi:hypothetical protein
VTITPGATGTETFADRTSILGIANLDASGRATISGASLAASSHDIIATNLATLLFFDEMRLEQFLGRLIHPIGS